MKQVTGWWVPDTMTSAGSYVARSEDLTAHIARCAQRRSAVQAGGHVGVYPRRLSESFNAVYTFEPHPLNFAALVMNVESCPSVCAARGFLGALHGRRELILHKNSGGHHTGEPGGYIPTYCIDDLVLDDCDAIFLDTEGFEYQALKGALQTIERCRPLLVLEENKQGRFHGIPPGSLAKLVAPFGYKFVDRVREDIVLQA